MPRFVTAGASAGMGGLCTLQISVLGHSGYMLVMYIVWQGCQLGLVAICFDRSGAVARVASEEGFL